MPLASEVFTFEEPGPALTDTVLVPRLHSRVRTNASATRLKMQLEELDLLWRAEAIEAYETNWHWTGTGKGYEILWRDGTTWEDLWPLARL
jgi:hypothetical protein